MLFRYFIHRNYIYALEGIKLFVINNNTAALQLIDLKSNISDTVPERERNICTTQQQKACCLLKNMFCRARNRAFRTIRFFTDQVESNSKKRTFSEVNYLFQLIYWQGENDDIFFSTSSSKTTLKS